MIKDILQMDGVRLIHKNFSGKPSTYNRKGDRNFAVVIDDPDVAQRMAEDGWNIKIKPPREEGDNPLHFLSVKVKFNADYPRLNPAIYLRTGDKMNKLDEETVNMLDDVNIANVDLDIRPFNYDVNGKTGISAYLVSICVTQDVNRFELRYAEEE